MKKAYLVTLYVEVDPEEFDPPYEWDWPVILDMPFEDVILEDVTEIEE